MGADPVSNAAVQPQPKLLVTRTSPVLVGTSSRSHLPSMAESVLEFSSLLSNESLASVNADSSMLSGFCPVSEDSPVINQARFPSFSGEHPSNNNNESRGVGGSKQPSDNVFYVPGWQWMSSSVIESGSWIIFQDVPKGV